MSTKSPFLHSESFFGALPHHLVKKFNPRCVLVGGYKPVYGKRTPQKRCNLVGKAQHDELSGFCTCISSVTL